MLERRNTQPTGGSLWLEDSNRETDVCWWEQTYIAVVGRFSEKAVTGRYEALLAGT